MNRDAPTIRPARIEDLDPLEALENDAFQGDRLSRRSLRYYVGSETADFLVIEVAHVMAGDAIVAYRRGSRTARLYTLAIAADHGGRGLGRELLSACEKAARSRNQAVLRLEVRADNSAAIRLYERAGYVQIGDHDDYYEDGATALRFEKRLI